MKPDLYEASVERMKPTESDSTQSISQDVSEIDAVIWKDAMNVEQESSMNTNT